MGCLMYVCVVILRVLDYQNTNEGRDSAFVDQYSEAFRAVFRTYNINVIYRRRNGGGFYDSASSHAR